jgi:hypothetical protein
MYGALLGFILGLLTRVKNQPHGQPHKTTPTEQNPPAEVGPIVISYTSPPLTDEEIAEKKERTRREVTKFKFEKYGLLVLAIYTGFTGFMWWETRKAANAAQSAAETSARQLGQSQRPWVTAKLALIRPPSFHTTAVPGLTFNKDGSATLDAYIVFRNIGQSVATDIYAATEIAPLFLSSKDKIMEELKRHSKTCDAVRRIPFDPDIPRWPSLFPGEDGIEHVTLSISKADIDTTMREAKLNPGGPLKIVSGIIYGCVNYRYATSSEVHQTRFVYELVPVRALEKGTLPPSKLTLEEFTLGGKIAD